MCLFYIANYLKRYISKVQNRLCQPGWVRTLLNVCIRNFVENHYTYYFSQGLILCLQLFNYFFNWKLTNKLAGEVRTLTDPAGSAPFHVDPPKRNRLSLL